MIATLRFKLPEEQLEYGHALRGPQCQAALEAIAEAFRRHRKYDAEPVTEELFYQLIQDCGAEVE